MFFSDWPCGAANYKISLQITLFLQKTKIQVQHEVQKTQWRSFLRVFFFLFWTADSLDPGDNGSHYNDSQNAQPETDLDIDTGFDLIDYGTEFDENPLDGIHPDPGDILDYGVPPNAIALMPDEYYIGLNGSLYMYGDWVEPNFLTWDIPVDSQSSSRYRYSKEKIKESYESKWKDKYPELEFDFSVDWPKFRCKVCADVGRNKQRGG